MQFDCVGSYSGLTMLKIKEPDPGNAHRNVWILEKGLRRQTAVECLPGAADARFERTSNRATSTGNLSDNRIAGAVLNYDVIVNIRFLFIVDKRAIDDPGRCLIGRDAGVIWRRGTRRGPGSHGGNGDRCRLRKIDRTGARVGTN